MKIVLWDGHSVVVNGDLDYSNTISNGSLIISGNLTSDNLTIEKNGIVYSKGNAVVKNITIHQGQMKADKDFTYTAVLMMDNADSYLSVGGCLYADGCTLNPGGSWYIKAGTIELKGDLDAKTHTSSYSNYDRFKVNGSAKVIFNGDKEQKVTSNDISISNAFMTNNSIISDTGFKIDKLCSDWTIDGDWNNMIISNWNSKTITIKGNIGRYSGIIGNGKLIVEGDVLDSSFTIDNSGEVLVNGNLTGSSLSIHSGKLDVKKNFTYTGSLVMDKSDSYLSVSGTLFADGSTVSSGGNKYLRDGVIELKGDIDAISHSSLYYASERFVASGNLKVFINGDGPQMIKSKGISIGNAYIENTKVYSKTGFTIGKLCSDWLIDSDMINMSIENWNMHTVTVKGNVSNLISQIKNGKMIVEKDVESYLNVSEAGEVNVKGNIIGSSISIQSGRIIVDKDLTYTSTISMGKEDSYLEVGGTLYADGYSYNPNYGSCYLSNGTIVLKGDLDAKTHKATNPSLGEYSRFRTSGSCKVKMCGEQNQSIISKDILIHNLYIDNDKVSSETGFKIDNLCSDWLVDTDWVNMNIVNWNDHTVTVSGEVKQYNSAVSNGKLLVSGDLIESGLSVDNNGLVDVSGNVIGTTFSIHSGKMNVGKDFTFTNTLVMDKEDSYLEVGGILYADGRTYYSNSYLTKGTIELGAGLDAKSHSSSVNSVYRFKTSGDLKVIFSGNENQIIKGSDIYINNAYQKSGKINTDTGFKIINLCSDLILSSCQKSISISKWNDFNVRCEMIDKDIVFGLTYPSNYNEIRKDDENDTTKYCYEYKVTKLTRPSMSKADGSVVEKGTKVSFNTRPGVDVYYTLDGSNPNKESAIYDGQPLVINADTTIKAISSLDGVEDSDVVTYSYTLRRYNIVLDQSGYITLDVSKAIQDAEVSVTINDVVGKHFINEMQIIDKNKAKVPYTLDGKKCIFVMPASDVTVSALFDNNKYSINYHYDDDVTLDDMVPQYEYSVGVSLPIPKKKDFRFVGWTMIENDTTHCVEKIGKDILGEIDVWAVWEEKQEYSRSFEGQRYFYNGNVREYEIDDNCIASYSKNGINYIDNPIEVGKYYVKITRKEDSDYKEFSTVIEDGLEIYRCTHSGTIVVDNAEKPSCEKVGWTAGSHCSICGEAIEKQEEVPATGHTEVPDVAVAPKCEETGLTVGSHCSVCNKVIKKQEEVPATGHEEIPDAAVAPKCEETGLTAGSHCSVCNKVIKKQEEVPATGKHIYKDGVCTVCGSNQPRQTDFGFAESELTKHYGDLDFALTASGAVEGSTVTYSSSNPEIATIDENGTVKIIKAGEVVITANASMVGDYMAAKATCTLKIEKAEITPNKPADKMNVSKSVDVVNKAELPAGWIWSDTDKDKTIVEGTTQNATALYNGADKGNYVTESVVIAITRAKHEHVNGEIAIENESEPSCTVAGSYDEVIYCTECNKELSRVTKTKEVLGHTPKEKVIENKLDSTCSKTGVYDEVVYCSVCEEEISRTTVVIQKKTHIPAKAVKEDEKLAKCEVDGSYDEAVYCSVCHEELGRTHKIISPAGHDWGDWKVEKNPTETSAGIEKRICKKDPSHVETREIPKLEAEPVETQTQQDTPVTTDSTKDQVTTTDPSKDQSSTETAEEVGKEVIDSKTKATYVITADEKSDHTVVFKDSDSKASTITVPKSVKIDGVSYKVTSIAEEAFKNNKTVINVKIGANVESIGVSAFEGCIKLKKITLSNSIKEVGDNAFKGCTKLETVTIPKNVTSVGDNAFDGCKKLKKVTIGANVQEIGKNAFAKCTSLETIVIPASVRYIGDNAFRGDNKLKNIIIKTKNLTNKTVSKNAFKGVKAGVVIKVPKAKLAKYTVLFKKKGLPKAFKIKSFSCL